VNISDEAVEAAARALWQPNEHGDEWVDEFPTYKDYLRAEARKALEAAAPQMMAPILALCDEADTRRGSSMYCKLTTHEVRTALGVKE
jgi:hypothetical protein